MPELGRAALVATLGLLLYAALAGGYAARAGRRRLADSAGHAVVAAFGSTLVAFVVLAVAFLRDDFGFAYVAGLSNVQLPSVYKLSGVWSGQEGSLVFWLLVLTGYASLALRSARRAGRDLATWATPVFAGVGVGFAFILVVVTSPFTTQIAPADGAGLNPSLQNPYTMVHPIFLYLGYVGLTVPFAFAMGSLLAGRADERWIVVTRRWTLVAWTALGIGQIVGSKWAYEEIGWGGFYAWDPVENAALMPWLAATAFLHSVMIQEKRGMLKVWNVVLVSFSFCLALFGTFLTRSGVLTSVHSFTKSPIGAWFLGLLVLASAFSIALIVWRLPLLRARTRLESIVSREAAFLYNNLLFVALTLTILWGVVWPLVTEAVRGEAVVVGPPFYNFFLRVLGLPLLLLMGLGPLVAWRRNSLRSVGRAVAIPAAVSLVAGAALLAAGAGSSPPGLIGYTFSAFVAAAIVLEFWRGARARRALTGESPGRALASLVGRNRRRYGGYVVHFAIVLLAIGIIGASSFDRVAESQLRRGDTLQIGAYSLTLAGLRQRQTANATELRAVFDVRRGGRSVGQVEAGKNAYTVQGAVSTEAGIRTDWLRAEDLFVIADRISGDGSVYVKVFVKPLVNLLWLAGFVFLLGSVVASWPDRREARRLSSRYPVASARAPASAAGP